MRRLLLLMGFFLFSFHTWGQERTVGGKVTSSDDGSALPGVNVIIKGTSTGTVTDIDGNYTLTVPSDDATLVFSFVGLATQEVPVGGRSTINVQMATDVTELNEVVVTALNISREKASLGYSQQTLEGDAVSRVRQTNFINSLSGKVAGVQVRTNNTMGGSTDITIRGTSSFTNNQPLFVIDGVPVGNDVNNSSAQQSGRYGYDYGNPAADINPEDIASMSVLKGAAATALYGSRGQNGVILITTKTGEGRKGIGVTFSTGVTVGRIDKETFAEYQNEYGAGYGPYYIDDPTNPNDHVYFHDADINGDGQVDFVVPTTEDASYGAAFDPNLNVYHWDSFVPESPNFNKAYPWTAAENTPEEFFETQTILNNTIALSGGNENTLFRVSYTNVDQEDILPNSSLKKHTLNFTGSTNLTDKLSANVLFQYNRQDVVGRFSTGYSDNLMSQFRQWWQVNVDMKALEDIYKQTRRNYTWNAADFTDPLTPIYWDNPYWTRFENFNSDDRDRVLSKVGVAYKFTDWLTLTARASLDYYDETREERRAVGSIATEFGVPLADNSRVDENSGYQEITINSSEYNYDALLTLNKDLSEEFSLYALLGFNLRKEVYDFKQESTRGGLAVPRLYALSNSVGTNPFPFEYLWEKEVYGYFSNVNLGFRNFLYLDASYRLDVSSALPVDNNEYNYYQFGLGFVFSELVDMNWMDFGKLRASYGTVGNDTRPLRVKDVYSRASNLGNAILTTIPSNKANPDLKAERTEEYEFGLQFTGVDQRVNFDISYYNRETFDQLLSIQIPKATGFNTKFVNAGTIRNRGFEVILGGDIIKSQDWTLNTTINYTRNRSKVLELIGDTQNYVFNSFQGGVSSNATVGQPFGVLRGTGFEYVNGQPVVEQTGTFAGMYRAVPDQVIGDPNPDYNMGISTGLSYKGVRLNFLVDIQSGGDVYSLDMHYGQGTGVLEHTAGLNHLGNPKRDPVDEGGGVLNPGVTESGEPNTVVATADYYGGTFYWGDAGINPGALTVYDASYVKLRELSLTYRFPTDLIEAFANRLDLSLVGNNLWIIHKNVPYADPESGLGAGLSQGYLSGSYPTVRTLGFKLEIEF